MKPSVFVCPLVSSLIAALALTATAAGQNQPIINVNNVEGLYAAVSNPANAGAIVVLASGTYTLTLKDPNNQLRPLAGRLVLQPGMALVGQNSYVDFDGDGVWDPRDDNNDGVPDTDPVRGLIFADPASETIIDAVNLSGAGGGQGGAVRVGLDNRVERLTVRNANIISATIDINVLPPIGMHAEIRDCLIEDGIRGIRLISGPDQNGTDSSAVLERNILRRMSLFGVQVAIQGASNSSWDAILRNNLLYSNHLGFFAGAEGSTNVSSHILSMRNLYRQNGLGLNLNAGRDVFPGLPGSNGSSIHLTSIDDGIFDNSGSSVFPGVGGGVVAIAGLTGDPKATLSSNNALDLQFIGTRWRGNLQGTSRRDLQVWGAQAVGGGLPGINDTARVLIRHGTSDGAPGAFQFIDSEPADPSHTNSVTIIGSRNAFIHTNVGIEPPPAELFSPHGSN